MEIRHSLASIDPDHLKDLVAQTSRRLGRPALSDAAYSVGPGRLSIASHGDAQYPDALLVGVAYGHSHLDIEILGQEGINPSLLEDMLPDLLEEIANRVQRLRLWLHKPDEDSAKAMRRLDFSLESTLIEMRCPLPLQHPSVTNDAFEFRAFIPGVDESAWLDVNRRSFHGHPEQGTWSREDLISREAESWFDAEGFITAWRDGKLAGSCWTKVHEAEGKKTGEIYVIGIDPDEQGRGLGRSLVSAGFEHLAGHGCEEGFLSVRADNESALSLYASLGLVGARRSELWERSV
ncbi:MAG: mycothiol synthase [Actinobacteria bacterium]|nr:mycothiol synthase [Actinomycetota bacterium]